MDSEQGCSPVRKKSMATPELQKLPDNVRAFWEAKEREFDERLIKFSYSTWIEPVRFPYPEKSGLCYLMERHLCFEDFPKGGLFFFNKPEAYTKISFRISLEDICSMELLRLSEFEEKFFGRAYSRGWLAGLFPFLHPEPTVLVVGARQPSNQVVYTVFRDLDEPEAWLSLLHQSCPPR